MTRSANPRPAQLRDVLGAPSWRLATDAVEAFVTRDGGHLGPVTFETAHGPVQPFAIAPWAGERLAAGTPGVLKSLRGDFFCLPFGGNNTPWRGETHPVHGATASRPWRRGALQAADGIVEFSAEMRVTERPGRVLKRIRLRVGETNVYCQHELHGFEGPMSVGHHAMLAFPEKGGEGRISLSPWQLGRVLPLPFENPAQGGYSALKIGAAFRDLQRVPLAAGGITDLTRYPAREGFEDLVMVSARRPSQLAWTTVTFPKAGYLWFGLKDPRTLASTVFWHSNGGRHYPPWNGRHRRVLGLEEVTSYFHLGLAESAADNTVSSRGIPTVLQLRRAHPLAIRYVMGVAAIPPRFDVVRKVHVAADHLRFEAASGAIVEHKLDRGFFS